VFDAAAGATAIVEVFATGNASRVAEVVASDYLDHQGLDGHEIHGPEGFRKVVAAVHSLQDVHVSIEDIVAARDRAAVRLRWRGADGAGREVIRETLDLLRFEEGLLVEHWGAEIERHVG
jgi:hypothetical protein